MHYPPLTHTHLVVGSVASRFFPLGTVVLLRSLLHSLARRIPYAEPSDLATIFFSAQHYCSREAHQIQPVAVAQKTVLTVVFFHVPYPTASIHRCAITQMSDPCIQQSRRSRKVATEKRKTATRIVFKAL